MQQRYLQSDKANRFRTLHVAPDAFVVANVWDSGSARMMAGLGFAALATSSGASAGMLGRRDGGVTCEETLAQARVICGATDLQVSADLERGSGTHPKLWRRRSGRRRCRVASAARSRTRAAIRTRRSLRSAMRRSGSPEPGCFPNGDRSKWRARGICHPARHGQASAGRQAR